MVSLIFRRKPALEEIRSLKDGLYEVFHSYMIDSKLDIEKFNKLVILGQSKVAIPLEVNLVPEPVLFLNDEKEFFNEEYLGGSSVQLNEKEEFLGATLDEYLEDCKLLLNSIISASFENDTLVKMIGYSRILTEMKKYYLSDCFYSPDPLFAKITHHLVNVGFIEFVLQYHSKFKHKCNIDCKQHRNYQFFCHTCSNIGTHDFLTKKETTTIVDHIVYHYDKFGKIEEAQGIKSFYVDDYHFCKNTLFSYRNLIHNKKQLEVNKQLPQIHFTSFEYTNQQKLESLEILKQNFKPLVEFEYIDDLHELSQSEIDILTKKICDDQKSIENTSTNISNNIVNNFSFLNVSSNSSNSTSLFGSNINNNDNTSLVFGSSNSNFNNSNNSDSSDKSNYYKNMFGS